MNPTKPTNPCGLPPYESYASPLAAVVALRTELTKCGARVSEEGDSLHVLMDSADALGNATVCTCAATS